MRIAPTIWNFLRRTTCNTETIMKKNIDLLTCLFCLAIVSFVMFVCLLLGAVIFDTPHLLVSPPASSETDIRLKELEADIDYLQRDLVFRLNQKLFYYGGMALLISFSAAFLGWKTYRDLDKIIHEKIRTTLENELYQLDPANLTVRLPRGHPDTPLIHRRLQLAGLKKLRDYLELNKECKRGLTIVPVNNADEEQHFRDFLIREKPDPELAAFVVYTAQGFRVSPETLNQYERVAVANMPATVITAILAISRGLHKEKDLS